MTSAPRLFTIVLLLVTATAMQAQEDVVDTLSATRIDTLYVVNFDSLAKAEKKACYERVPMKWCSQNFNTDFTYAFAPFVVASLACQAADKDIRAGRNKFTPNAKTSIDDYLQYSPLALAGVLKLSGVESRSDWVRFLASGAMSYAIMAALNNGLKYTICEMRPDNTSANSFPSGHTATAFVGATILHKEYGMTRSPWYSVAGYTLATATALGRSLNNRHWLSDLLCGAGIGIISTDLGYFLGDLIFRDQRLLREDLKYLDDYREYPSFISWQAGATFLPNVDIIEASTASTVGVEAAYFFHPYWGIGLRGKLSSAQAKICSNEGFLYDQLAQVHADIGAYFQYPFEKYFCIGAKVSYGRMMTGEMTFSTTAAPDTPLLYVPCSHTNKVGAGLSLAYTRKHNTTWKVFCDYDYSSIPFELHKLTSTHSTSQNFHMLTLGASANIRF